MSEHTTPQRADISHAHDKHGRPVRAGQVVELVWAGEHHRGLVETVERDEHGVFHAHVTATIVVPATATSVREDENPTDAPGEGSAVHHQDTGRVRAAARSERKARS